MKALFVKVIIVLLCLTHMVYSTKCNKGPYEWWTENVKAGERGFIVNTGDGHGQFLCGSKGFNAIDEVLDPVVSNTIHIAMFEQNSNMPCRIFSEKFEKHGVEPRVNETERGKDLGADKAKEAKVGDKGRRLVDSTNGTSCKTLGGPKTCNYPNEAIGQNSWGGVSFKISRVNDKHTTEHESRPGVAYEPPYNVLNKKVSHAPVYGGTESACQQHGDEWFYSSGVVLSGNPLPNDMKYKMYAFASDKERELALADSRNDGLKYAHAMKGENGCDVEIVYEFFPKTGGGLMVEISQTMQAFTEDDRHKITDTTAAYIIPELHIGVVQVSRKAIRETQYLPLRKGCDEADKMKTTIKFSTQFICKATGERVNATLIQMSQTHANGKIVSPISTDPNNPTTFQVDPANPTDCYWKMDCAGHQHEPDFEIHLDAQAAPESCGSFYWDPLLQSVSGDGQSASAVSSSSEESSDLDTSLGCGNQNLLNNEIISLIVLLVSLYFV